MSEQTSTRFFCPRCGNEEREHYACRRCGHPLPEPWIPKSALAAAEARTEKAEEERDEARGVADQATRHLAELQYPDTKDRRHAESAWHHLERGAHTAVHERDQARQALTDRDQALREIAEECEKWRAANRDYAERHRVDGDDPRPDSLIALGRSHGWDEAACLVRSRLPEPAPGDTDG